MEKSNKINLNYCLARRNQTTYYNQQCPHLKKVGDYCGKHKNYLKNKLVPINQNNNLEVENNIDDFQKRFNEFEKQSLSKKNNDKHKTKKKNNYSINFESMKLLKKKTLTIIDYLYDRNLDFNERFIKKTFKYYKLDSFIKKKKMNKEIIKIKLKSLFETILLSYINIDKIVLIQKSFRNWNKNFKYKNHGPAIKNRMLCNNHTDFYNLEDIKDIPNKYFFSYKDNDEFIYGFHIESFINLISNNPKVSNPYNRIEINKEIKNKAIYIWQKINKKKEEPNYVDTKINSKDIKYKVKHKCLNILQKIDLFGYQTSLEWLMDLSCFKAKSLYRHIRNYWNYKAGLSEEVKSRIYPNGNPFININARNLNNTNRFYVLDCVSDVIENIIGSGVSEDDKNQGCIIILFAINEINRECERSNPWLI